MGIRIYRPTSAGRRNASVNDYAELTAFKPEKSLCKRIRKTGGRNHSGETTARFRGGGARKIYRVIDFKRDKDGVPGTIATVEYDPNRNCFISLVNYSDGEKRYILAPQGIKVGAKIESGDEVEPKVGNAMKLATIPAGIEIHNIEMTAGQGGKLVRGAGNAARIVAKEGDWVTVILPSGEMRMIRKECRATIGQLSNPDHQNIKLGKAGRTRH
ncbi:MAG: 50S ribosomal protein L2, partial [Phycisphaerae bacterium]